MYKKTFGWEKLYLFFFQKTEQPSLFHIASVIVLVPWLSMYLKFGFLIIIYNSMSEVIEDMEMLPSPRTPYYVLASTCRLGVFCN